MVIVNLWNMWYGVTIVVRITSCGIYCEIVVTKLSSEIEQENKEVLGGVQSGMHLVESRRPSGRTESKEQKQFEV